MKDTNTILKIEAMLNIVSTLYHDVEAIYGMISLGYGFQFDERDQKRWQEMLNDALDIVKERE